jgi:hypothetical protein
LRSDQLIFNTAILLTALLVLATPTFAAAPFLVGSWFGQGQPHDKSEMWLAHMGGDGTFRAQFRACIHGNASDSYQTGTWSLTGDIETIHLANVDGYPISRVDVYRILAHTAQKQTYRYEATGFVYNSNRVDEKFEMPSCDLTS